MPDRRNVLRAATCALVGSLTSQAAAQATEPDIHPDQILRVDGRRRRYRLVVPPSAAPDAPLMIALHGMGIDSISLMPLYSGLDDMARVHGCVLAYPASLPDHWPLSFGERLAMELRFLDALVAEVQRARRTDPRRIYLLGMSNGGYFAVVVASRRSQYLAGLAVHSGSAGVLGLGFSTQRKFPVYVAHGADDPIIPARDGRWLADMFRRLGHPTQYEEVPRLGHIWARDQRVNERIWSFWHEHPA